METPARDIEQNIAVQDDGPETWRLALRDWDIRWIPAMREENLHLVAANPRFLILSCIRISNLGLTSFPSCDSVCPLTGRNAYDITPILMEALVQPLHRLVSGHSFSAG